MKEQARARYKLNTSVDRNRDLMARFGISAAEYDRLGDAQGGVCAICLKRPKQRLAVDHDHATGKIRGLLCGRCNPGLGMFGDSEVTLSAAIKYLQNHT